MYKRLGDPGRLAGLPEHIEEVLEGPCHVVCMAFNPFGSLLATGCKGGEVVIWDYETRGMARTFHHHSHQVTSLLWSRSGRRLLSGCAGGVLATWDVLEGRVIGEAHLGRRGITHLSMPSTPFWGPHQAHPPLLVSFSTGPALLRGAAFAADGAADVGVDLPAALGGAGAGAGGQLAVFSPSGDLIVAASGGLLSVLRCEWGGAAGAAGAAASLLDVVKLQGLPPVAGLRFDAQGRRLLVATQDRYVRVFELPAELRGGGVAAARWLAARRVVSLQELEELSAHKHPKQGSLVHAEPAGAGQPQPLLRLIRRFEFQGERSKWGAAMFSPDCEHIVSSVASGDEHVIYTWHAFHGYPENTLQGGKDGVVAMTWHPEQSPMQLLALGASGRIYIWAKILTQNWSAFAPDFEDLSENREHVESETEFDVNPAGDDDGGGGRQPHGPGSSAGDEGSGLAAASSGEENDEDVEVVERDEADGGLGWLAAVDGEEAPLLTLPVLIPDTTDAESEEEAGWGAGGEEVERSEGGAAEVAVGEDAPPSAALQMLLEAAERDA